MDFFIQWQTQLNCITAALNMTQNVLDLEDLTNYYRGILTYLLSLFKAKR